MIGNINNMKRLIKKFEFFNKYNTGLYDIRMTQYFIDESKVDSIKKSMINGDYNFDENNNIIGVEIFNNVYYITEGHHRMNAALKIWSEYNDYSFVEKLISNSKKYIIKKKPLSYKFKF